MPGKLNLYGLGQGGVNVVKSPIQLMDDECRSAQNAIYSPDAEGGLRKRGALTRLNATALNGGASILAAHNVALPNPFNTATLVGKYLYLPLSTTGGWKRTSDGATWVTVTEPQSPALGINQGLASFLAATPSLPVLGPGYFLYPQSNLQINKWDGTSDARVINAPVAPGVPDALSQIQASCVHNGSIYFSVVDPSPPTTATSRVYKLDAVTGQITNVGGVIAAADAVVWSLCSFNGQLFAGLVDSDAVTAANRKVWRINPDTETAWTADSAALTGWPISMVPFNGSLYIGTGFPATVASQQVYRRTASGAYSVVKSYAGQAGAGTIMAVFAGKVFAQTDINIWSSSNGTAWSLDVDINALAGGNAVIGGVPAVFNGALYWPFRMHPSLGPSGDGGVFKRTSGGTWSRVLTALEYYNANFLTTLGLL